MRRYWAITGVWPAVFSVPGTLMRAGGDEKKPSYLGPSFDSSPSGDAPSAARHQVPTQELDLVAHAALEVLPEVRLEVTDGIPARLPMAAQRSERAFGRRGRRDGVVLANLHQDRATHLCCMPDRPIQRHEHCNACRDFEPEARRRKSAVTRVGVGARHDGQAARWPDGRHVVRAAEDR